MTFVRKDIIARLKQYLVSRECNGVLSPPKNRLPVKNFLPTQFKIVLTPPVLKFFTSPTVLKLYNLPSTKTKKKDENLMYALLNYHLNKTNLNMDLNTQIH